MTTIPRLIMLGLLAERPWTAYELVRYLNRPSMAAALWDVSERTWYREPARLVEVGLADAHEPADGSPTTYTITDAGRRALEEASPTENHWVYRNEVAAVLYAVAGGAVEDIDARLEHLRTGVLQGIGGMADEMRRLAASGPTLARRAHVSALLARMCASVMMATHDWAVEAQRQLGELGADGDRAEFARNLWQAIADDLDEFGEQRRRDGEDRPA